jgi:hypothetical protein
MPQLLFQRLGLFCFEPVLERVSGTVFGASFLDGAVKGHGFSHAVQNQKEYGL